MKYSRTTLIACMALVTLPHQVAAAQLLAQAGTLSARTPAGTGLAKNPAGTRSAKSPAGTRAAKSVGNRPAFSRRQLQELLRDCRARDQAGRSATALCERLLHPNQRIR